MKHSDGADGAAPSEKALRHSASVRIAYPVLKLLVRLLMFVLGPVRTQGRRNVPRRGGLLILCNHLADIDPIVLQIACPRPIHYMAKSELFDIPLLRHLIRWFHAFPVKRGAPDRAAIRHAIGLLEAGEAVCVFPEGQLSEDGRLQPLMPGAALIVRKAGVPVLCVGLRNTNRVMPYGKVWPRPAFRFTWAEWGEPCSFGPDSDDDELTTWATQELLRLTRQG